MYEGYVYVDKRKNEENILFFNYKSNIQCRKYNNKNLRRNLKLFYFIIQRELLLIFEFIFFQLNMYVYFLGN